MTLHATHLEQSTLLNGDPDAALDPAEFASAQRALARFNRARIEPGLGSASDAYTGEQERHLLALEHRFIETARAEIADQAASAPSDPSQFVTWFERLREHGPGQGDALFPWLATTASYEQMRWFLEQEVAGEAGFDDLVAMTQVKMPARAKLEMARN
jgi:hypothetical protein